MTTTKDTPKNTPKKNTSPVEVPEHNTNEISESLEDSVSEEEEFSDSLSSDEENEVKDEIEVESPKKFKELKLPTGIACIHYEPPQSDVVLIREMFPMKIEEFFTKFFSDKTDFWNQSCLASECTEISIPKWEVDNKCCWERDIKFTIPVKHFLGPKSTKVTQTQRIRMKDSKTIEFETFSVSHNVPYSTDFVVESHWKVVEEQNFVWCNISWEVRWKTQVFFKSMIERNALHGAKEYFDLLIITAKNQFRNDHVADTDSQSPRQGDLKKKKKKKKKIFKEGEVEVEAEAEVGVENEATPKKLSSKLMRAPTSPKIPLNQISSTKQQNQIPPLLFLLIPIILGILLIPLVHFNGRLSTIRDSLEERDEVSLKLDDRFIIVQSLLLKISKNITDVPGKTLREQWERYWSKEHNMSNLNPDSVTDFWDEQISFWERSFNTISNFMVSLILLVLKIASLGTFGIVVGLALRYFFKQ